MRHFTATTLEEEVRDSQEQWGRSCACALQELIMDRINLPNMMESKEAERAALCVRDSPECGLWAQ